MLGVGWSCWAIAKLVSLRYCNRLNNVRIQSLLLKENRFFLIYRKCIQKRNFIKLFVRILLLDETENLIGNGFTRDIRDHLRTLSERGALRLVVAACTPLDHLFPDSNDKGKTSPFQGNFLRVQLKSWEQPTVRRFITTRLENTGICFSEAEMEKLWLESQGHPQKLMQACFYLYCQYRENL